jgi:hypothetical protein
MLGGSGGKRTHTHRLTPETSSSEMVAGRKWRIMPVSCVQQGGAGQAHVPAWTAVNTGGGGGGVQEERLGQAALQSAVGVVKQAIPFSSGNRRLAEVGKLGAARRGAGSGTGRGQLSSRHEAVSCQHSAAQ